MKMNVKLMIISVLLVIGGASLIVLAFAPKSGERQEAVANWVHLSGGEGKEVQGTVVNSELDARTEGARRSRSINNYYCPVYDYTVADTKYSVVAVGDDCKEKRDQVALGSTATILYDETDPAIAFVKSDATQAMYGEDTSSGSSVWLIVFGVVLVVFGALGAWGARPKASWRLQKK